MAWWEYLRRAAASLRRYKTRTNSIRSTVPSRLVSHSCTNAEICASVASTPRPDSSPPISLHHVLRIMSGRGAKVDKTRQVRTRCRWCRCRPDRGGHTYPRHTAASRRCIRASPPSPASRNPTQVLCTTQWTHRRRNGGTPSHIASSHVRAARQARKPAATRPNADTYFGFDMVTLARMVLSGCWSKAAQQCVTVPDHSQGFESCGKGV